MSENNREACAEDSQSLSSMTFAKKSLGNYLQTAICDCDKRRSAFRKKKKKKKSISFPLTPSHMVTVEIKGETV